MPEPKYVISMGSCANNGGPYWRVRLPRRSRASTRWCRSTSTCPAARRGPEALLYGVMKLQEKIQEDRVLRRKGDTLGSLAGASMAPEAAK